MDKALAKAMFAARDARMERVLRHNFGLVRDIHPDRLSGLAWPDAAGWEKLLACPEAVRTLSRDVGWLVPGAPAPGWIDLPAAGQRLGLLPWPEQRRLLVWFGMAVRFRELRRCIDGGELRRLSEIGGPEARTFAFERGSVMIGERVRALFPDNPEMGLAERVEWVAAGAWAGIMGDADPAYAARCRLILPPGFEKRMRMFRPFSGEERRRIWAGAGKMIREALPQWVDFFS